MVSISPNAIVPVPGHGQTQINNALVYGGPSLLVQTVEQLTHVPINHYARLNLTHVTNVMGGVNVTLPETTKAFGYTLHSRGQPPRRAHCDLLRTAVVADPGGPVSSLAHQLWTAIRQDSIGAFAKKYPSTVTPGCPAKSFRLVMKGF